MSITFRPNTVCDVYLALPGPPTVLDFPQYAAVPLQQYPPYTTLNFDQVDFAVGPVTSFFFSRGALDLPVLLKRATSTMADYLVIDPGGVNLTIMILQAEVRLQPATNRLQYWIGKSTLSY